jgi:hypothetical protein
MAHKPADQASEDQPNLVHVVRELRQVFIDNGAECSNHPRSCE